MIAGLANATLSALTRRLPADRSGGERWAAPVSLAVRVVADAPTTKHRAMLGSTGQEVTAVLYVPKPFPVTPAPANGDRVAYAVDGSAARTGLVLQVVDRVKAGGLSHLEVLVKE